MLNRFMVSGVPIEKIEIGMGATLLMHSDRHPATVISKTAKTVTIQEDKSKRIDSNGMSESQEYEYERNPNGRTHIVRLTKRGWKANGTGVGFGWREEYYDFSF